LYFSTFSLWRHAARLCAQGGIIGAAFMIGYAASAFGFAHFSGTVPPFQMMAWYVNSHFFHILHQHFSQTHFDSHLFALPNPRPFPAPR
jgi:hypothetical protein